MVYFYNGVPYNSMQPCECITKPYNCWAKEVRHRRLGTICDHLCKAQETGEVTDGVRFQDSDYSWGERSLKRDARSSWQGREGGGWCCYSICWSQASSRVHSVGGSIGLYIYNMDIFLCVCSTSIKSLLLKKRERLSNVEQFHWAPRPVTSEVTSKRCWISSWPAGNSNHQYGSLSSSPGAAPGEELATSVFSPCPGQWQWKMFQMTNHIMNTNGHFPSGILQALYPCPLWQSP